MNMPTEPWLRASVRMVMGAPRRELQPLCRVGWTVNGRCCMIRSSSKTREAANKFLLAPTSQWSKWLKLSGMNWLGRPKDAVTAYVNGFIWHDLISDLYLHLPSLFLHLQSSIWKAAASLR